MCLDQRRIQELPWQQSFDFGCHKGEAPPALLRFLLHHKPNQSVTRDGSVWFSTFCRWGSIKCALQKRDADGRTQQP